MLTYRKLFFLVYIFCQKDSGLPKENQIIWADVFVVVYSITDRDSFEKLPKLIRTVQRVKNPHCPPIILLGNKKDLDHLRAINVDDAQQVALEYGCHFYEVSAAESYVGVNLAFYTALREARAARQQKLQKHMRRLRPGNGSFIAVSKMLGHLFAKKNVDPAEKVTTTKRSASLGSATITLNKKSTRAKSLSL